MAVVPDAIYGENDRIYLYYYLTTKPYASLFLFLKCKLLEISTKYSETYSIILISN